MVYRTSRSQELKIDFLTEKINNLLVRNQWTDFNIILQNHSFGDLLPSLFKAFWFIKKHGPLRAGLIFPIYLYRRNEKSSCQKPLDRFQCASAEMFSWWPSTKIVQPVLIRQKITWSLGRSLFSLYIHIDNFKNVLVINRWTDFNITWQECFVTLH